MKKQRISILAGLLAAVMILSLLLTLLPASVSAVSSSEIRNQLNDLKDQKKELAEQIAQVKGQYQANENEIEDMVNRKNSIDQQIALLHAQIDNINQQIAAYALLIADKQDELDEAQFRLDELNEKNKERIRAMEEDGNISYWSIIFKASSFSDLLDRLSMIEEIAASDQKRLKELSEAADLVASAQAELKSEKDELNETRQELDATQAELDDKRAEADALLTELVARGEEFQAMLDASEALQEELMEQIAQKEKDLKAAEYQEWLATYVPPTTKPTGSDTTPSDGAPSSSGWISPLKSYKLTSPFGMRKHPILGYERMHNGVDMAAPAGTPIYAAKSGKVTAASFQSGGAGNYVSINHGDGFSSIYMHMTRYIVSVGDYVSAGQVIGYVGSTGLSNGNHLHFGISYNGTYVNPMKYI
ncbi:MAG: peptidoglycan DD-metalloendopeptidase family protein [Clostridiales bacterium]|nr:peptidoglycan DD-metalloendopeptidase family protein [Clostridiales bacterium]